MKDMNKKECVIAFAHPLCITRFDTIVKLLIKEKKIQPKAIPQVLVSLWLGLVTAVPTMIEYVLCYNRLKKEKVTDPVYVMGHWRSGTTLVQHLLSKDKRFGTFFTVFNSTFNFYHVLHRPYTPLVLGQFSERRPMDNMRFGADLPMEEYIAFSKIEADSVYAVNYFPQSFNRYMDNSYWQDLPAKKAERIKRKYDYMLRKCSEVNGHKRLMLKSPDNTGRISVLHEMYPDAKFINIYRNPYTVIRSTLHMYDSVMDMWAMQDLPDRGDFEDWVIDNFVRMYKNYFAFLETAPEDCIYEIRFEDFEKDPFPYLREAYEKLDLGDYEAAKQGFEEYWKQEENYKKNVFEYPEHLKKKIEDKLGFYFEHYGYKIGEIQ